jgi:hypothetical protein
MCSSAFTYLNKPSHILVTKSFLTTALLSALSAMPFCLDATTIVDLGGASYLIENGVSNSNDYTLTPPLSGHFDLASWGTDTAVAITLGSVWEPLSNSTNLAFPVGKSGVNLKMGAILSNNDSATAPGQQGPPFQYTRITRSDAKLLTFQFSGTNPGTRTDVTDDMSLASIFYYEKSAFLNGGASAASIALRAGDYISATFALDRHNGEGRILIRNAGDWYVSVESVGNGTQSLTVDASDQFYRFDPSGNNFIFHESSAGSTIKVVALTDIDAVGIHLQHRNYDGTSAYLPYQFFESITANVTTGATVDIPEPGMFSMLAGLLALGVVVCRRRRIR